jgi:hypothetical protein
MTTTRLAMHDSGRESNVGIRNGLLDRIDNVVVTGRRDKVVGPSSGAASAVGGGRRRRG